MSGHHTRGRLEAADINGHGDMGLVVNGRESILTVDREGFGCVYEAADAHRLAACWNAFEGMLTEHVEQIGAGGGVLAATMMAAQAVADRDAARAEVTNARTALATAEQLLVERDKTIAQLDRRISFDAKIVTDLLVGNQAAWIEWQRGAGAEEAMVWVQNSLMGVGVPEEGAAWATEPQAWWDANKAEPFPPCFCGRPSNILTMGRGFCSWEHSDESKRKDAAETAGATGMPLFDGTSPDTEGGSCD